MIENNLSRLVAVARFNTLRRWTHKAIADLMPEPANGSPPGDAPPDAPPGGGARPRAMIGFSIPAYAAAYCACGQIWIGPVHTSIDENGFLWNCKGCRDRFTSAGAAPVDPAPPEDGAP